MNILQVTKKFPYPIRDGESVAVTNLSRGLVRAGFNVSLFSINTSRHYYPYEEGNCPSDLDHYAKIYAIPVNTEIHFFGALSALAKGKSYLISRFENIEVGRNLEAVLKTSVFDCVILETTILGGYADVISQSSPFSKLILRAHNIEYEVWKGMSNVIKNPFKKHISISRLKSLNRWSLIF